MPTFLTAEQVLFIHSRLVSETGGAHGLRDIGLLLSAVARPKASFDQQDLYPTLHAKAAELFESLISNHPFIDGNKRTAITAAGMFLHINGYRLNAANTEVAAFTLACAQGVIPFLEIIAWFEQHSELYL